MGDGIRRKVEEGKKVKEGRKEGRRRKKVRILRKDGRTKGRKDGR